MTRSNAIEVSVVPPLRIVITPFQARLGEVEGRLREEEEKMRRMEEDRRKSGEKALNGHSGQEDNEEVAQNDEVPLYVVLVPDVQTAIGTGGSARASR